MAKKLLISVAAQHVSVAQWRGKNFAACERFVNDDSGLAQFREYLAATRSMPAYLMVDAVEEDYRFDSLPHSFGPERREMVTRKLKQHFRNTPYCGARLIGRDTGKRRDDRYMFAALTNPELINPWVQAIAARELPLAGVYLLPTVSQSLLHRLQLKDANLLVVSIHSSGMRLTYFRDQKLRVSRLARTEEASGQVIKGYAEEISNTRLYLHALRIMTLDEALTVLIVDRDDSLVALTEAVARDNPNVDCQRLDRKDIAARIGVSPDMLDASADALYLHLLGLHPPGTNLAAADLTAVYRQYQGRRIVYAAIGATAFAAAGWCAFNLHKVFDLGLQTAAAARSTAEFQARYQAVTHEFPAAPTSADNLKRAVEISGKIGTTLRSPERLLVLISNVLDAHPSIIVQKVAWRYGTSDIGVEGLSTTSPVKGLAATPAPAGGNPTKRHQSGLIEGEVRPFRGDYRAAIETINAFAASLSQQSEVAEVKVTKLPLSVAPNLTLTGNTTETREQADRAEFRLTVMLKP